MQKPSQTEISAWLGFFLATTLSYAACFLPRSDIPDAQFSVFEAFLVQSVRLQGEIPCPNIRTGRALLLYQSFVHLQLIPVVGQFFQVKRAIVAELEFLSRPSEQFCVCSNDFFLAQRAYALIFLTPVAQHVPALFFGRIVHAEMDVDATLAFDRLVEI